MDHFHRLVTTGCGEYLRFLGLGKMPLKKLFVGNVAGSAPSHCPAADRIAMNTESLVVRAAKPTNGRRLLNAIVFFSSSALAGHLSGSILPIAGGMEGRWLHP